MTGRRNTIVCCLKVKAVFCPHKIKIKNVKKKETAADLQCVHHHRVPVQAVAQHAPFLRSQAMLHGFIQTAVLTEQLHQLHVHVSVSWPRRQLGLEEVEQPVPALLTLTAQQTLLQMETERGFIYTADSSEGHGRL